jgi:hypothetical protein
MSIQAISLPISRHSAREWRNSGHMDVTRSAVPGTWIPAIRAGMTVTRGIYGVWAQVRKQRQVRPANSQPIITQ